VIALTHTFSGKLPTDLVCRNGATLSVSVLQILCREMRFKTR